MGEWARWVIGGVLGAGIGAGTAWITINEKVVVLEQAAPALERRVSLVEGTLREHVANDEVHRQRLQSKDSEHDSTLVGLRSAFDALKERINEYLARRR